MSYNKFGERSPAEIKSAEHKKIWKEEIDESIGRSSKDLGIYNRPEVEKNIRHLYENIPSMDEFKFIQSLRELSPDAGVYIVGGSVRDAVLKKPAKDIDLIINKVDPIKLIDILLKNGKVTFDRKPKAHLADMTYEEKSLLIKESYGVIKFLPENSSLPELIDIAFPREDDYSKSGQSGILGIKRDTVSKADPDLDIIKDLERRDLTINAMAVNLMNGDIIDPFEGIEDIVKRKIRSVGNPDDRILKEDLSRGFRAIRFGCVFSSDIENETKKSIREIFKSATQSPEILYHDKPKILAQVKQYEKEVRENFNIPNGPLPKCLQVFWDREQQKPRMAVAKEVMSIEILKSISANPKHFIELMEEIGGLEIVLPELNHLKNLRQPREFHSEGDAFRHTMMLLDNLPAKASLRLKLAALFHDLGKANTQKIDENGKITFHGHEKKSAEHMQKIAKRFRMSAKLVEETLWLIENHMFSFSSNVMRAKSTTLEKMFLENEDLGHDLIALSKADILASKPEKGKPNMDNINLLIQRIEQIKQNLISKGKELPRLITGKDLIEIGFKPGPEFSAIMEKIREAQLNGKIKSKKEALDLAKKI